MGAREFVTSRRGRSRAGRALIGGALALALPAAVLTFLPASPASAAACTDVWTGTGTGRVSFG